MNGKERFLQVAKLSFIVISYCVSSHEGARGSHEAARNLDFNIRRNQHLWFCASVLHVNDKLFSKERPVVNTTLYDNL